MAEMKMGTRVRALRCGVRGWLLCLLFLMGGLWGCESPPEAIYGQTLQELALENARACEGIYTYPQALIDGLSRQLIDELRCMDPNWLEYYEPCKEVGCIWAYGPQPYAARPEVLAALRTAAASKNDYITITAGYRDVGMQYFSRWFRENCNPNFHAAEPGKSNHQGGRAIDVQSYNYWNDTLLAHGFDHPIPTDRPHYELRGDAHFRQESSELRTLSVQAFQVLWNRNNPDNPLDEDGLYGPLTKTALGSSPVAGFPVWGCGLVDCAEDPCGDGCDPALCVNPCDENPCGDDCDPSACEAFCFDDPCHSSCPEEGCVIDCALQPCADGCDPAGCSAFCVDEPCGDGCDLSLCPGHCDAAPCTIGCDPGLCAVFCASAPCHPDCPAVLCEDFCAAEPCAESCPQHLCPLPDPNPCRDDTCEECIGDSCMDEPDEPDDGLDDDGNDEGGSNLGPDSLVGKKSGGCSMGGGLGGAPALLLVLGFLRGRRGSGGH